MLAQKKIVGILGAIALVGLAGSAYFYAQYQDIRKNPGKVSQEEVQKVVNQVAKLMVLPTNEVPTVATVTDPEQLKNQSFFANAAKGDKVLIYTNARKAILFDPAQNKIIEVAPVSIGQGATAPAKASDSSTSSQ